MLCTRGIVVRQCCRSLVKVLQFPRATWPAQFVCEQKLHGKTLHWSWSAGVLPGHKVEFAGRPRWSTHWTVRFWMPTPHPTPQSPQSPTWNRTWIARLVWNFMFDKEHETNFLSICVWELVRGHKESTHGRLGQLNHCCYVRLGWSLRNTYQPGVADTWISPTFLWLCRFLIAVTKGVILLHSFAILTTDASIHCPSSTCVWALSPRRDGPVRFITGHTSRTCLWELRGCNQDPSN